MMLLLLLCVVLALVITGMVHPKLRERWWAATYGAAMFIALTVLNLTWPDFFPMGERLRDYAMLSEVMHSPVSPQEPWFAGYPLNYYLNWYRVGALFGLVGMPPWEVYHLLGALSMALGMAATAALFSYQLGGRLLAAGLATIIWLGANPAGMVAGWVADHNWWGPSRVVTGAINEFPAWSWLLGDLHPHYLNLCALPLALWLCWRASSLKLLLTLTVLLCWNYSANAWDTAPGLLLLAVFCLAELVSGRWRKQPLRQQISPLYAATAIGFGAFCILTTLHLVPVETPLRFVDLGLGPLQGLLAALSALSPVSILPHQSGVLGSKLSDFVMHWGFWLVPVVVGIFLRLRLRRDVLIAVLPLLLSLILGNVALLLVTLVSAIVWLTRAQSSRSEALLIASLLILLVPELIFFDDPYGGENERMNTIFKFYSYAWIPLGIGSLLWFLNGCEATQRAQSSHAASFAPLVTALLLAALMLPWTFQTISVRQGSNFVTVPRERGLSHFERTYPGAAKVIETLYALPGRGIVAEAENGAYQDGAFIATLSSKPSYLGWANHVGLLLRHPPELARRQQVLRDLYTKPCEEKRLIMVAERISYLVVGDIERKAFDGLKPEEFACLPVVVSSGRMTVVGR